MKSVLLRVFLLVVLCDCLLWAIPIYPENATLNETWSDYYNETNGTAHDLYVIRTVIYEIGILTDADNDTDNSNETHEQVDLTFYDPKHNSTAIDLSNIPVPIQTNVSGQVITGIAPADFGVIYRRDITENGTKTAGYLPLKAPIFPNILISQTSNISTTDTEEEKKIIEGLPEELGI